MAQLVADGPCLSRTSYNIGVASGTSDVSPNLSGCAKGMSRIPMERAGTVLRCGSMGPSLEGVWARTMETEV